MTSFWRLLLKLCGWKLIGQLPDAKKYVIIFYPHTSNWDFILGVIGCFALRLDFSFLGKHSLFEGPFGWVFHRLGGIPVKRDERKNMVAQVVEFIDSREHVALAIAPEGTRSKTDHWKSGFYHIARAANVPIAMAFIDGVRREIGISPVLPLTGDLETDKSAIRAFYQDKGGVHPELAGPIDWR